MERYIYLDGKFVDRVSDSPKKIAKCFGCEIDRVEKFEDAVCGKSERVYLKWPDNTEQDIKDLKKYLKEAKMTKATEDALKELIDALEKNNQKLAYHLSGVKSLVGGMKSTFGEDTEYNQGKFDGVCLYSYLDGLHHDIAYRLKAIPRGMTVMTTEGAVEYQQDDTSSPTLKLMEKERKAIWRKARR